MSASLYSTSVIIIALLTSPFAAHCLQNSHNLLSLFVVLREEQFTSFVDCP